jgi:hypothetical protein
MLDYSIKDHLALFISPDFYYWTGRGGYSSTQHIQFYFRLDTDSQKQIITAVN